MNIAEMIKKKAEEVREKNTKVNIELMARVTARKEFLTTLINSAKDAREVLPSLIVMPNNKPADDKSCGIEIEKEKLTVLNCDYREIYNCLVDSWESIISDDCSHLSIALDALIFAGDKVEIKTS